MIKKKTLIFLLIVCMIATVMGPVNTVPVYGLTSKYVNYTPDKIGKASANINIRKDAGTKYGKIDTLPKGTSVIVYGYKNVSGVNWYKIKYKGKLGFVSGEYLTVRKTKVYTYQPIKTGITTARVNMRKGSNTECSKISTIPSGANVKVYGYEDVPGINWYKVSYDGKIGYISGRYLNIIKITEVKYVNYSPDKIGKATADVVFRKDAGTNSEKIGKVLKDTEVIVFGYKKVADVNWYRIKNQGKIGYVSGKYLKVTSTPVYTYDPIKTGIVTASVTMRKGSNVECGRITTIPKGENVTVYGYDDVLGEKWYKVGYDDKIGYINGRYLNLTNITESKYVNYSPDKVGKTTANLSFRKDAGTKFEKIGEIPKNINVIVFGYKKIADVNWYKIKYDGKLGYVSGSYLTVSDTKVYTYNPAKSGTITARVNMHKGSNTQWSKIISIPKGEKVIVYGYEDVPGTNWYKVGYNEYIGYISGAYLNIITPKPSNITGKEIDYPTNHREGQGFGVKGKIVSTYNLANVSAMILDKNGNTVYSASESPNKTTFSLVNFDNDILFSRLKIGSYTYKITAKDIKGKSKTLLNESFKVIDNYTSYESIRKGITTSTVNMRKTAGTKGEKIMSIPDDSRVNIYGYEMVSGKKWYKVKFDSKIGFASGDYIKFDTSNIDDIEGFPASYQNSLKQLKAEHPTWKFIPQKTGMSWETVVKKEMRGKTTQLVAPGSPSSWIIEDGGSYDGRWKRASKAIVKYYLDPRNFLNENSIYQFMEHNFDASYQTKSTVKEGTKGSFMSNSEYVEWIYNSGRNSGVNPNVLVAMIIMEQGWKGTSDSISGTYKGYKGYYNYFNIGAFTTDTMKAVERGLWYAKGEGKGKKEHGRPWNTREKSITGGGKFYDANYMKNNQYTMYTKKFNVMNGSSKAGTHEYCTNVQAADQEGKLIKRGFDNSKELPLTFKIPVYSSMPSSKAPLPR